MKIEIIDLTKHPATTQTIEIENGKLKVAYLTGHYIQIYIGEEGD